ncbi:hypothetical protein GCM10009608_15810 [Pseudonocardia alaniniphila]
MITEAAVSALHHHRRVSAPNAVRRDFAGALPRDPDRCTGEKFLESIRYQASAISVIEDGVVVQRISNREVDLFV